MSIENGILRTAPCRDAMSIDKWQLGYYIVNHNLIGLSRMNYDIRQILLSSENFIGNDDISVLHLLTRSPKMLRKTINYTGLRHIRR